MHCRDRLLAFHRVGYLASAHWCLFTGKVHSHTGLFGMQNDSKASFATSLLRATAKDLPIFCVCAAHAKGLCKTRLRIVLCVEKSGLK